MFNHAYSYYPQQQKKRWPTRILLVMICILICYILRGTWQGVEQLISQQLVGKAFAQYKISGVPQKRWYLNDSWPVFSLSFPNRQERLYVLAGVSADVLKHGPGHLLSSAYPGQMGNALIQSDETGYFDFLPAVREGELIEVESQHGRTLFRVVSVRITSGRPQQPSMASIDRELTLIAPYSGKNSAGQSMFFQVNAVAISTRA